ncbi:MULTISPECIES: GNAT family N-acetyltransferase [Chitinophagaceae]
MEISHVNTSKSGYFKAELNGEEVGMLSYIWADDKRINVIHTGVEKAFTKRGIAHALVMDCIRYARENDLKIVSMCSYVRYVFEQDPGLADVLER